ncbi:MAG: urease accessory protein UreD [Trichormus sp.]
MAAILHTQKSWHGKLNLVYSDRLGKTELIYNHHQAPLKVQRPFYPEGEKVCHSIILHTAGGVVGGDRLSTNIHLQPHSQAVITTAAAGKIYRSNGLEAQQTIDIKIDAGACLEWLPQETILFNGAIYRQNLRVELASTAKFIAWEITRFGRSARGEKFYQGKWRSHTEIWQNNLPVWIDRQYLPGNEAVFHSPHALSGQPIAASFIYVGSSVTQDTIEKVRSIFTPHSTVNPENLTSIGVTTLENGCLCRYRGASTAEVRNWFTSVWQMLRFDIFNRSRCIPRVWG